eukprot:scaffold287599_cov15-Tisochrysis_lutea.AAC.1
MQREKHARAPAGIECVYFVRKMSKKKEGKLNTCGLCAYISTAEWRTMCGLRRLNLSLVPMQPTADAAWLSK